MGLTVKVDYMGQIEIEHVAGAHMGVALGSSQAASVMKGTLCTSARLPFVALSGKGS